MDEQQDEARKIVGLIYMFRDVSDEKYSDCLETSIQVLNDHLKEIENIKFKYYEHEFNICKDEINNFLINVSYNKLDKILENFTILLKEEHKDFSNYIK